jgi:hypothetical protein
MATKSEKLQNERISHVKNLKKLIVKGEHHVHLDSPEMLYEEILGFIHQPTKARL